MSIESAYARWAATYDADRNLTRDLDRDVTRRMLGGRRFRYAIEVGCGTGKNTGLLAEIAAQVVALDFSPAMLAQAKDKVRAPRVAFRGADVTQPWPCADHVADLVTCNLVLEHVEQLDAVFKEVARCLDDAGMLYLSELHPFRQYEGAQARFTDAADTITRVPAFLHHVSDFLAAAERVGLVASSLREWWHADDAGRPPRLLTLEFARTDRRPTENLI